MTAEKMTPESLAQFFHETYERLAPDFGYKTRQESRKPWAEVPESNRRLMIAVCANVLAAYRVSPDADSPKVTARKWAYTKQRDELKRCPFCGTQAIEQGRLADNQTDMHYRILCGNPFCNLDCATHICADLKNAEHFWQERTTP